MIGKSVADYRWYRSTRLNVRRLAETSYSTRTRRRSVTRTQRSTITVSAVDDAMRRRAVKTAVSGCVVGGATPPPAGQAASVVTACFIGAAGSRVILVLSSTLSIPATEPESQA